MVKPEETISNKKNRQAIYIGYGKIGSKMFIKSQADNKGSLLGAVLCGRQPVSRLGLLLTVLFTGLYPGPVLRGQEALTGGVSYRVNESFVIYDLKDNGRELDRLNGYISQLLQAGAPVKALYVKGYSSPDGSYGRNEGLSKERAGCLSRYIGKFFPGVPLEQSYTGEDWGGLLSLLQAAAYPQVESIRRIALSDLPADEKENRLKSLPGGIYKELLEVYFPRLRRATLRIDLEESRDPIIPPAEVSAGAPADTGSLRQSLLEEQGRQLSYRRLQQQQTFIGQRTFGATGLVRGLYKPRLMLSRGRPHIAVGSDILLWAGLRDDFTTGSFVANLSLEYYFGGRWSLKASGAYSKHTYDGTDRFQGRSFYLIEPRLWLGRQDFFEGLFLGVYFQGGDYNDVHLRDGHTGDYYSAGVSAGYLLNLYKGLYLEAGLRGGYRHLWGDSYLKEAYRQGVESYRKNSLRLTGSSLSLIYRF